MNIYTIYKVVNNINQKEYIGYTSKSLNVRINQHSEQALKNRNNGKRGTKFHNAILYYGMENFSWEIIYQSLDKNHCKNEMEPYFINEFNSQHSGYNGTSGGDGIDSDTMKSIRNDPNSVYNTPEYKDKRAKIQSQIRNDPNSKFNTGDFKSKVSANMNRLYEDKNSFYHQEEYRKSLSEGAKRFWEKRKAQSKL